IGLTLVHFVFGGSQAPAPVILLLGAEAAATAPAATLMVVKQYKARGPVTDALLPVVALDDAIGLMIFSVCMAVAKVFASPDAVISFSAVVLRPLLEIVLSLGLGAAIGALLALCMRFFKSRANRLTLMVASVLLGIAVTELLSPYLSLSSLLVCMMIGALFANLRDDSVKILEGAERWTPPLFMAFFVISGANLQLDMLLASGIVGIVYILFRVLGKYFGARLGATVVKANKNIRKYLGVALIPQAGVAIGMAVAVASEKQMAPYADKIVTVVLCATLVYELIGPVLTKIALTKAGEIEKNNGEKSWISNKK
ncbi:MAG: cation:proton antiporter, partial [Clostridia bacterium]|nr:cation:proton antiporter [Clostridia bacterium]